MSWERDLYLQFIGIDAYSTCMIASSLKTKRPGMGSAMPGRASFLSVAYQKKSGISSTTSPV